MANAIQFNQIPGNLRVPFLRFEVNAGSSPYQSIQTLLLIGQMTAAGTATPGVPIVVFGSEMGLFGAGSQLASMYNMARQNAPFQEIWCLPLVDLVGATQANGKVAVTGAFPLTVGGTIILYVGGIRVEVPVNTIMTAAQTATAIAAAINACQYMQVTATVNALVPTEVDLLANNAGTLGNTINILPSYYPDDGSITSRYCTITQMSGGASDPMLTASLATLGDGKWDWTVFPYCNSFEIGEVDAWLTERWGPMSQTYGHAITALSGTAGQVMALTSTWNSWHVSVMPVYNAPHPIYLWAAAVGGQTAQHMQTPPELSRPLQTVQLVGLLPPLLQSDQWSVTQRQAFYYAGASGYVAGPGGDVQIDRLITTYQKDAYGLPDQAWLDVNTIAQLMYGLPYIAAYMTETYPRAALVNDNPNNIQGFVTVKDITNAFIHVYNGLEAIGVFQDADTFAQLLIVERNAQDPNRVDTYLPVEAVNQLRVLAVNATSYLQYPTA